MAWALVVHLQEDELCGAAGTEKNYSSDAGTTADIQARNHNSGENEQTERSYKIRVRLRNDS
jgi:hypothetical protein